MFIKLYMLNGNPVMVNPALVKVIRSYGEDWETEKPFTQVDLGDTDVIVPGIPVEIARILESPESSNE